MRGFTIYAPAKLNLFLDVVDKRPDGYHNIETVFEKIDLKDEIRVKEKRTSAGISIEARPTACPAGKDNIVYNALKALLSEAKVDLGLEITIDKKIPAASGLGGGSSDAAAVLMAVNESFELGVSLDRICAIAAKIGKDIPFFLADKTFAAGSGTGEVLKGIDSDWELSHVIVKPKISKSTQEMYSRLDNRGAVFGKGNVNKTVSAIKAKNPSLLKEAYYNIFEQVLIGHNSPVAAAKKILCGSGAGIGFLSGSGPSVFCVFEEREEAVEIFQRIPKEPDMEVFVATSCK